MNKVYFGITREVGNYRRIVGVTANTELTGCRPATSEERLSILDKIKADASEGLSDSLRDDTYPNVIVVWDKRADARAAIATLESYGSPHFKFSVGEFGDAERKVTKPKGWRIMSDADPGRFISAWNTPGDGATARLDGNFENTNWNNCLFPNRAKARKVIVAAGLAGYIAVRVDA